MTPTAEESSVKIHPKTSWSSQVVRIKSPTVPVGIYGLHNFVAIDRVTLANTTRERIQNPNEQIFRNQLSTNHENRPTKLQAVERPMKGRAEKAPENDDLLRNVAGEAGQVDHYIWRVITGDEKKDGGQNVSSIESPKTESTANIRCIMCERTATVSTTTQKSRQNTSRNKLMRATSSA